MTLLITLVFLGFSVSAVAHPCSRHDDKGHRHCDRAPPPPEGEYLVELTAGPFQFGPKVVTLNSKKQKLKSVYEILMDRPELSTDTQSEQYAWDDVFETCAGLLTGPINQVRVSPDSWSVYKNSSNFLGVMLDDIYLTGKEIQISLHGTPGELWVPAPGQLPISFTLDQYTIWGKPSSGPGRSWDTCFKYDGTSTIPEGTSRFPISTLKISNKPITP